MKPIRYTCQFLDGTDAQGRILAIDKIKCESYARRHGWDFIEGPRLQAVMVWFALRRDGHSVEADFDEFVEELADFEITRDDDELDDDELEADPS